MPLLDAEIALYPDDLLGNPSFAVAGEERFWVLHTRPRAEKGVTRRLLARNIPFFLPIYERSWVNKGRRFRSHLPLFPGYVFAHGGGEARLAALETHLVANVLPVPDPGQLQADLARVHRLLGARVPLLPEDRLEAGSPVVITHGAMEGLEGVVVRREKDCRFVVNVHFLQRGVSVRVEGWMIRPRESV